VDFVVPVDSLNFEVTSDGVRHGNVELSLVAYDHGGKPLNWIVRSIRTSLKPDIYPSVQKTGAQFHREIDVPKGDVLYLRSGVYDLESDRAGTLEIPLSDVTIAEDASPSIQNTTANQSLSVPAPSQLVSSYPASSTSHTPATPGTGTTDPVIALANVLTETRVPPRPEVPVPIEGPAPGPKELDLADIPAYCATLAGKVEHSAALASVCEFALNMRMKLPNIVCDRETKRYWITPGGTSLAAKGVQTGGGYVGHADVVTANVTYRDGQEYYSNVRKDGKPANLNSPELSGTWSDGEFATILAGIFVASSKTEFHYEKEGRLRSTRTLAFNFHVTAQDNRLYFLRAEGRVWFPEYRGRIWLDARTFSLLRLERETGYMPQYPITRMKTTIDYSDISLGDGSKLVLPTHSDVMIWTTTLEHNGVKFANWHKFRATANIVMQPSD
jgi:hypothetical protein